MIEIIPEKQYGNFLNLPPEHSDPQEAKIVILPIPYERTTCYGKGTARGPQAIIDASAIVEYYDPETERELYFECGIATLPSVTFDTPRCHDLGQLRVREDLWLQFDALIDDGRFVVTLGGEHTVSIGSIPPHSRKCPHLSVLQIDAHADLRDQYEGTRWSHACIMRRLVEQLIRPSELVQVGLRAYCQEEVEYAHRHGIMQLPMHVIRANYHPDFGGWQQEVVSRLHKNVYVTFDVDGLDPSIMPATGTPVPGGLKWDETIELFRQIKAAGKKIVGLDMVELAPHPAHPHCDFTVAQLIYNILNFAL